LHSSKNASNDRADRSDEVKQLLDAANLDAKGSGVRLSLV